MNRRTLTTKARRTRSRQLYSSGRVPPAAYRLLPAGRRGLTLVEMLVSLVCVLLLMMAYTQLFSDVGSKVGEARSMIELDSRLRSAAQRLRTDLESHTCDMSPWQRPESGSGYFEIIEGPLSDRNNGLSAFSSTLYDLSNYPLGDTDDVLMFTIRSKQGPYIGRIDGATFLPPVAGLPATLQSSVAEVVWFLRPTLKADNQTPVDPPTYTLYRRQLLVLPTQSGAPVVVPKSSITNGLNDISAHPTVDYSVATDPFNGNTLGDLTKRECRFAHAYNTAAPANGFPHTVDATMLVPFGGTFAGGNYHIDPTKAGGVYNTRSYDRYGEDVVLTNVLSFDVQVWDPTAPKYTVGGAGPQLVVGPGETGFTTTVYGAAPLPNKNAPTSQGAYVDLNWFDQAWAGAGSLQWSSGPNLFLSPFFTRGHPSSQLTASSAPGITHLTTWLFDDSRNGTTNLPDHLTYSQIPATFDTWSFHYEMDGVDQDLPTGDASGPDQGTDQIAGIAAGSSNYETSPPYPVPLRGLRIRIRCYEPDARDVREVTITESFVPQ